MVIIRTCEIIHIALQNSSPGGFVAVNDDKQTSHYDIGVIINMVACHRINSFLF